MIFTFECFYIILQIIQSIQGYQDTLKSYQRLSELISVPDGGRVINGDLANITEFPYAVIINNLLPDDVAACTGSIISENIVLTAAHCYPPWNFSELLIISGSEFVDTGRSHKVEKVILHENANPTNPSIDDIAIVHIEDYFEISDTTQIGELPPSDLEIPEGAVLTAAGWGRTTNESGAPASKLLYQVSMKHVSLQECREIYVQKIKEVISNMTDEQIWESVNILINENKMCAIGKDAGVCNGDSGGPLIYKDMIVGIASTVFVGCDIKVPAVYVKTSAYIDWINKH